MSQWVYQSSLWRLPVKGTRGILVHHHVDHGPEAWLVTFYELGIEARLLKSTELEDAKAEAIKLVLQSVRALGDAVLSATGKP